MDHSVEKLPFYVLRRGGTIYSPIARFAKQEDAQWYVDMAVHMRGDGVFCLGPPYIHDPAS